MKVMDKHIIVFTWAYLVTKWIKNRVLSKNNTGFLKYSLYSSHIWQNKHAGNSMFGPIFNTKNAKEIILNT